MSASHRAAASRAIEDLTRVLPELHGEEKRVLQKRIDDLWTWREDSRDMAREYEGADYDDDDREA